MTLRRFAFAASFALGLIVVVMLAGRGTTDAAPEPIARAAGALGQMAAPQRVRTHRIRSAALENRDRVSGISRAFHHAKVTAETAGRVVARRLEPGARAQADQVILELDDSRLTLELQRAEATLRARRNVLAHAQREQERGESMVARNAISEQRRDDLQHALDLAKDELALARVARDTAERNLADTLILAPFAGTVDALLVDIGDYVQSGTPVATVIEMSRARVFAGVTAQQAAQLQAGGRTTLAFAALGGVEVEADLQSVASVANERDGTYTVEFWVEAPPPGLRDGMVATVMLPRSEQRAYTLAPRAALMRTGGQPEIFVVESREGVSVALLRRLRTGHSAGEWIEVLEGLREGDEVIVEGQFALREGAVVSVDTRPPQN